MTSRRQLTHINIPTLEGESKPGLLILHKVEGHLWVAFLLQVCYDRLANQLGGLHHVQHLGSKVTG